MNNTRQKRKASCLSMGYGRFSTYFKQDLIGSGTYSSVYKGISMILEKPVALKEIAIVQNEGLPFTTIREISILKKLKHANIITLHDILNGKKLLTLVFEYVDKDLKKYLDHCNRLRRLIEMENIILLLFQLLRAIEYCHSLKILHRDIKPQNILVSSTGDLKLADFGLARAQSFPSKTFSEEVVSLWYRPPDLILGNTDYGPCIDIWGFGCLFFELAAGKPTNKTWPGIESDPEFIKLFRYDECKGISFSTLVPKLNSSGVELLEACLKYNPKDRISSFKALHHPFFSNLPKNIYELKNNQSIFILPNIKLTSQHDDIMAVDD